MIFDGKAFAGQIEATLRLRLRSGVRVPKIVSVLVGDDSASELYTKLKKQAAERVGIEFEVVEIESGFSIQDLGSRIEQIGEREDVTGIMVQLPIPGLQGQALKDILSAIPIEKDVDGLRWEESKIVPATVRAVLAILENIAQNQKFEIRNSKIVVLGSRGAVGRPLVQSLKSRGLEVGEIEWDTKNPAVLTKEAEVVISCVGKAGLVTGDMVKEGVIAIDVGMSSAGGKVVGDMTQEVYQKASVAVPVPGGVGPVTISSLMANVVKIYGK